MNQTVTTREDFVIHGVPSTAVWDGDWEAVMEHIAAAEDDILEALRTAGNEEPIPRSSWSRSMRRRACIIAGYHLFRVRGWEPTSANDIEFIEEYKRCIEWLEDVAKGAKKPLPVNAAGETLDAVPETQPNEGVVKSEQGRGWGASWP